MMVLQDIKEWRPDESFHHWNSTHGLQTLIKRRFSIDMLRRIERYLMKEEFL